MAGKKHKLPDRKGPRRKQRAVGQELHHLVPWRRLQSRERDVRRIFALFGGETDALQRRLNFPLKMQQCVIVFDAGP